MPPNKSPLAVKHYKTLLDRALEEEHGIAVTCKNHGEAMAIRSRLHWLRQLDRDANAISYEANHPLHKHSVWDDLVCRIKDNVLTITHLNLDHLTIEPLSRSPDDDVDKIS